MGAPLAVLTAVAGFSLGMVTALVLLIFRER